MRSGLVRPRITRRGGISIGAAVALLIAYYLFPSHDEKSGKGPSPDSAERAVFASCAAGCSARAVDGDTLRVKTPEGVVLKVRLYGCDAPEVEHRDRRTGRILKPGQPFGEEALSALKHKVGGRKVTLEVVDTDAYGRAVAVVRAGSDDINMEMIADGMAECYREYLKEPRLSKCIEVEDRARKKKLGVWSLDDYERPSKFRERQRVSGG